MKKLMIYITGITLLNLMVSCATQMVTKSPQEVKMMTTKQFEANKNLVFKSVMSLLQSESYLIVDANDRTGLIRANKRLENKNAELQQLFLGMSKDANTSKVSFYIDEFNPNLTEVKITLYEGSESTSTGYWGNKEKSSSEKMVYDAQIYNQWFNNLRAEIERRRALTK